MALSYRSGTHAQPARMVQRQRMLVFRFGTSTCCNVSWSNVTTSCSLGALPAHDAPSGCEMEETMTAQAAFRKALSYELIPTNLAGAFASPAPPEDFDPNSASPATLSKHGFYWRRPQTGDDPSAAAAWKKAFSRKWLAKDRIVPHLEPQIGKTHRLRGLQKTEAGFTSTNWSGGFVPGQWASAIGYWVIPTVSKPTEAQGQEGGWNSSSWVGIDGWNSDDVLQAGVQQRVDGRGNVSYVAWYEWFCGMQKRTLADTSPLSPSLASLNGRLYLSWKGDGNDNLNVMVSVDNGQTFFNKFISGETSPKAPCICAHNGNLFIAWKGDGNDNLNVAMVDLQGNSITGFSNKVTLGDTSPQSPTLASSNGLLYLGWKGDGNDNLNVLVSADNGRTFGNKFTSPETSPQAPGLAAHNGNLYITWKGDGNDNLNVAVVNTSGTAITGFSNKVILGDTSPVSPTLASFNGRLYLGWKGDGNDNLNVMYSSDNGRTFGNKYISGETSPQAPVLTAHNGNLFIGWKGDGNDNLNVSVVGVDGGAITGFTTPPYVFQVNITNFPVSPGDTVYCSVQYVNNNTAGQLYFANDRTGQHFSITLVPPPGAAMSGNSIEWIMEAPDGGYPTAALPKFTPVNFTSAIGCSPDGKTVGNPQTGDSVNIVNGSQTLTSVTLGNDTVTIDFQG
jgi:hypothetical protein